MKASRPLLKLASALALLAACLPQGVLAAKAADTDKHEALTRIEQGQLRGSEADGVERYLGLPYASPPTGDLRWKPPAPPSGWAGVRDATHFGSECAQLGNWAANDDPDTFEKPIGSEDCLFLNVWAPKKRAQARPVIVFLHGGGSVAGAASLALYDGQRLAQELDAVFVSINYRLGFFGIIDQAVLKNGDPLNDSGSFAVLDQIAALKWVKHNIAAFGGDPSRVTVMGQSAGCTSIWNLMSSPLASGIFQKAFCMSGMPRQTTDKDMVAPNRQLLSHLLLADHLIASEGELDGYLHSTGPTAIRAWLYRKSVAEILQASRNIRPVRERVDGFVITAGQQGPLVNPVPAMLGTTKDEAQMLMLGLFSPLSARAMWHFEQSEDAHSEQDFFSSYFTMKAFNAASWGSNLVLHRYIRQAADLLAGTGVPVYLYDFEWDKTPEPWKSLWGAYHGIDLSFVFGNFELDRPNFAHFAWVKTDPATLELMHAKMAAALKGFIDSNDPNRYAPDLQWQRWSGRGTEKVLN